MKDNPLTDGSLKTKDKIDKEGENCVIGPFNVLSIKIRATKKAVAAFHQSKGRFRCFNFVRESSKNAYVATPFGKIYFECNTSIPEGFCAFECVLFRPKDKQEIIIICQKQKKETCEKHKTASNDRNFKLKPKTYE